MIQVTGISYTNLRNASHAEHRFDANPTIIRMGMGQGKSTLIDALSIARRLLAGHNLNRERLRDIITIGQTEASITLSLHVDDHAVRYMVRFGGGSCTLLGECLTVADRPGGEGRVAVRWDVEGDDVRWQPAGAWRSILLDDDSRSMVWRVVGDARAGVCSALIRADFTDGLPAAIDARTRRLSKPAVDYLDGPFADLLVLLRDLRDWAGDRWVVLPDRFRSDVRVAGCRPDRPGLADLFDQLERVERAASSMDEAMEFQRRDSTALHVSGDDYRMLVDDVDHANSFLADRGMRLRITAWPWTMDDGSEGCTPYLTVDVHGVGMPVRFLSDRQKCLVSIAPVFDRLMRKRLDLVVVDDIGFACVGFEWMRERMLPLIGSDAARDVLV